MKTNDESNVSQCHPGVVTNDNEYKLWMCSGRSHAAVDKLWRPLGLRTLSAIQVRIQGLVLLLHSSLDELWGDLKIHLTPLCSFGCAFTDNLFGFLATADLWPAGYSEIIWTELLFLWKVPGMLVCIMGETAWCYWCCGLSNLLAKPILCPAVSLCLSCVHISYDSQYHFLIWTAYFNLKATIINNAIFQLVCLLLLQFAELQVGCPLTHLPPARWMFSSSSVPSHCDKNKKQSVCWKWTAVLFGPNARCQYSGHERVLWAIGEYIKEHVSNPSWFSVMNAGCL